MNTQANDLNTLFSIEGKVALITGGSRGIGYMIAQGYVENGVRVYITSRTADECQKAAKALSKYGTCIAIPADVSTEEGRNVIYEALNQHEQTLDILVNNAGIAIAAGPEDGGFDAFAETSFSQVMDINVKAPFLLIQKLIGLLENNASQTNPARVINIGSVYGQMVTEFPNAAAYGPSKAAIHFMTQEMGKYLGLRGIIVNAIAPGLFESQMTQSPDGELDNYIAAKTPVARTGLPQDMAGLAIFLASPASAFINGEIIKLDGGYSL